MQQLQTIKKTTNKTARRNVNYKNYYVYKSILELRVVLKNQSKNLVAVTIVNFLLKIWKLIENSAACVGSNGGIIWLIWTHFSAIAIAGVTVHLKKK